MPELPPTITDTRIEIETPEGALLPLEPAGMGVRIVAFFKDWLIKFVITIAVSIAVSFLGEAGSGMYLIIYFLMEWFYPVYFEVWHGGQTPGKKSSGLMVVSDDGSPLTFSRSLVRNLLRVVDFLPAFYVLGICVSTANRHFKRVGDLAAGTVVVYTQEVAEKPDLGVLEKSPIPPNLSTDEQRALLNFAERAQGLSEQRQQELASIVTPIIGEGEPVNKIKKIANSMVGGE